MHIVWTNTGPFRLQAFKTEADLEAAILEIRHELFGPNRITSTVKRKIGVKGGLRNVPDGYLLDLTGTKPRLSWLKTSLPLTIPCAT